MKLTLILMISACLQVNAGGGYAQTITLSQKDVSLAKVFNEIRDQSGYLFLYNNQQLNDAKKVTIKVKDAAIEEVLNQSFKDQLLTYVIVGKTIVVIPKEKVEAPALIPVIPLPPPPIEIHGRVVNQQGAPLPNVSVLIVGTNAGTATNSDGRFTITAPDDKNVVLEVSSVGYQTKRVDVGKQTEVNVVLEADVAGLSDVVIVGYGNVQKKDLTGSVAVVDQGAIKNLPVSSVDQKLIGQVAGVHIQQASGAPGAGTIVKIRGAGSLGAGNDPLYVVDGMPYSSGSNIDINPLLYINPDDIESISILKDASSTAIYGSRGSNGVVMITTKKGRYNKTETNLSIMAGIQTVPQKGRPNMFNAEEFAAYQQDQIGKRVKALANREFTLDDVPEEYRYPAQLGNGTNYYDLVLRNAPMQSYNLNFSKGTKESLINFSLGYFNQDGVMKYTGLKRYTGKLTSEFKIGKSIKVGASLLPTFIDQKRTQTNEGQNDIITQALLANPVVSPYDSVGNLKPYLESPRNAYSQPWSIVNPLFRLRETIQNERNFNNFGSAFIEYEIIPNLKAKSFLTTIWSNSDYFQYIPSTIGNNNKQPTPGNGASTTIHSKSFNWLSENTLTYNKVIDKHRFNALAGYTFQENTRSGIELLAQPYPSDQIQTINAATTIKTWDENFSQWSIISYLSRINYSYDDKYLLTATIRSDGSSRFGYKKRYAVFPSIAAAWRISDENFLKDNKIINNLKLRASYGKSGNNNIGDYSSLPAINSGQYIFGSTLVSTASVGISNPFLSWEESKQIDAGLDLGLFANRLTLTIDFYNRKSYNMLLNDVVPAITGFNSNIVNTGSIRNNGIEIGLGVTPVSGIFNWDARLNLAFNRNKVLSLNSQGDRIISGKIGNNFPTHVTYVGHSMTQFFGFQLEGLLTAADMANPAVAKDIFAHEGGNKYKDINGDGQITDILDYTVIGNPWPDCVYGITNTFSYKNFNLSVIINGQIGGQVLDGTRTRTDFLWGKTNLNKEWLNRWISPAQPGDGMHSGVSTASENWTWKVNQTWAEDATYLRISNLMLSYSLPKGWLTPSRIISSCNIYFTIQNLAMFTSFRGANPEGQSKDVSFTLAPGWDRSPYPLSRVTSLGINLSF